MRDLCRKKQTSNLASAKANFLSSLTNCHFPSEIHKRAREVQLTKKKGWSSELEIKSKHYHYPVLCCCRMLFHSRVCCVLALLCPIFTALRTRLVICFLFRISIIIAYENVNALLCAVFVCCPKSEMCVEDVKRRYSRRRSLVNGQKKQLIYLKWSRLIFSHFFSRVEKSILNIESNGESQIYDLSKIAEKKKCFFDWFGTLMSGKLLFDVTRVYFSGGENENLNVSDLMFEVSHLIFFWEYQIRNDDAYDKISSFTTSFTLYSHFISWFFY